MRKYLLLNVFVLIFILGCAPGSPEKPEPPESRESRKSMDKRQLFRIEVEDADEAGLIEQQLGLKPERIMGGMFYYYGDDKLNKRLAEYDYRPEAVDPNEVFGRLAVVKDVRDEKALREMGVRILLREETHLIIHATPVQLRRLTDAGYAISDSVKGEPRPRMIRIHVAREKDLLDVTPYLSDYYSLDSDEKSKGYVIHGTAWDDMIDDMRSEGYTIEFVKDGGE